MAKKYVTQKLDNNITVKSFQPFLLKQFFQLEFAYLFHYHDSFYNRVEMRFTIAGFQVEKSPAMMCLRASPTSHR